MNSFWKYVAYGWEWALIEDRKMDTAPPLRRSHRPWVQGAEGQRDHHKIPGKNTGYSYSQDIRGAEARREEEIQKASGKGWCLYRRFGEGKRERGFGQREQFRKKRKEKKHGSGTWLCVRGKRQTGQYFWRVNVKASKHRTAGSWS